MKIKDMQVGTEYAETGPLAYGVEPNVVPRRVRLTDKRSGWGRVETYELTESTSARTGTTTKRWHRVDSRLTNSNDEPEVLQMKSPEPYTWGRAFREESEVGTRVEAWNPVKGHYRGEVYRDGEWKPTLIQSAAVHRTWVEHDTKETRLRLQRTHRKVISAEVQFRTNLEDAAYSALARGLTNEEALDQFAAMLELTRPQYLDDREKSNRWLKIQAEETD